jgi:CheY-like chemotaxis protein
MTHLLVIEDHPDIMYILTRLLRAAGYEVSAAHDGVEGVALALQLQPDLVLLDLAIPAYGRVAGSGGAAKPPIDAAFARAHPNG